MKEKGIAQGFVTNDINREYTDTVFRKYFHDEERLKSLYSSLTGMPYEEIDTIDIRTLDNVIYGNFKNDLAFLVNNVVIVFAEHQSTINNNMPLRMFCYAAETFWQMLNSTEIYRREIRKIPLPQFYVFYNGENDYEEQTLKLSDAFEKVPGQDISLELEVKVLNINYEKNNELFSKCEYLKEYAQFIYIARENRKMLKTRSVAVKLAIEYCISHGIMVEFLKKHGEEVESMLTKELSMEEMIEIQVEDGIKAGLEKAVEEVVGKAVEEAVGKAVEEAVGKAVEKSIEETARKLKNEGVSVEIIKKVTGLTLEQINAL